MAFRNLTPLASGRALLGLSPLLDLHRDMNRWFDGAFREVDARQPNQFMPRIEVHETQEEYCVSADLPGLGRDDVELLVEGDVLTVSGERKAPDDATGRTWLISVQTYGRFERSLKLPFAPDASKVDADFVNGVLTVHVPKTAAQERGRRISIGGARPAAQPAERIGRADEAALTQQAIDKASRQSQRVAS